MPNINLKDVRFHRLHMKTRFPFRYGIANMTEVPHLFVSVTVEVDGRAAQGISSDGLPPKWFTKNPDTSFEQDDLPSMLRVISHAAEIGQQIGRQPSFFAWWRKLYEAQHAWARAEETPQLLAGLGVSLIERAVLDAVCRDVGLPLFQVFRNNILDIDLSSIRPSLESLQPRDVLPPTPNDRVILRHTIGLGDPLSNGEKQQGDNPQDGLPFTLQENIEAYGLRYFKIKLSGDLATDRERLTEIASIVNRAVGLEARFTLDGNENFETIGQFREAWRGLLDAKALRDFFGRSLLFVEQPVHRSRALDESVGDEMRAWTDAPHIIIDESDAELASLPTALALGYSGTSHKNCKGIIKGLLGAAMIARESSDEKPLILSAEDLGNIGPVALMQDLAMVAALGISHVERNGHHYFAGLNMFPAEIQESMLLHHGDLYAPHDSGFAALAPSNGMLSLKSVNEAPFGLRPRLDVQQFDPWEF